MSNHVLLARLAIHTIALGVLAGCAGQPVSVPQEQFHRLNIAPAARPRPTPALNGPLEVERFLADGVLGDRAIAYVRAGDPDVLRQDRYHFWSDAPTRMLQQATAEYLRSAGVAGSVVTPEWRVSASYSLFCRIRQLEYVVGSPWRVVVDLEYALRRNVDDELLLLENYRISRTVAEGTVGSATGAMSLAIQDILAALLDDLTRR